MPCETTDLQSKSSTHFSYQVFTTSQCSHILIAVCIKYGKRETVCVTDLPELLPTFRMWNLDIIPHSISEQLEGNLLCSVCQAAAGVGGSLTAGEPRGLPAETGRARPRGQGLSRHPRRGAEQAGGKPGQPPGRLEPPCGQAQARPGGQPAGRGLGPAQGQRLVGPLLRRGRRGSASAGRGWAQGRARPLRAAHQPRQPESRRAVCSPASGGGSARTRGRGARHCLRLGWVSSER